MFKHTANVRMKNTRVKFTYKVITCELLICHEKNILFRQFLWLPYKKYQVTMLGDTYQLSAILFPIKKISLLKDEQVICSDLFPKLRRYTIANFAIRTAKKIAMLFALIFG